MGMQDFQINNLVVANAYGYHVVCETFAKAIKQVYVNQSTRLVDVDPAYQLSATALEYDAQGLFLGAYAHAGSVHYYPTNPAADRVEFLSGAPVSTLDEVWANTHPYDPYYDWRVYALVEGQWEDVSAESTIGSSQIQAPGGAHLIRTNKNVLYQHLVKPAVDGTYIFPIEFAQPGPNGTTVRKIEVNPGQWRAYLNGYYLTQGLDFDIRDGVFYLLSRQYLVNAQTQDQVFDIFAYGLADPNLQTQEDRDAGFCYQGKLSVNGVYNVREHKVNIGFVAGKLVDLVTMRFEEDEQNWVMNSPLNGKPYCIESALVNTRSLVQVDSYTLRSAALDVDKQVSSYLTGKFTPAPPEPVVNPIENRHALYSVFLTKLITAIIDGEIAPSGLPARYTSSDVRQMVQPYMWLYEYDALNPDFNIDSDFVAIYPHPFVGVVELSVLDYAFINHVVTIFGNGRTQLTGYVSVSS